MQATEETLDQFITRLQKLDSTCDFADFDKELKSVIIQNCSSKWLHKPLGAARLPTFPYAH